VLPQALKKKTAEPYTLEGVSVRWADLQDALYAAGQWPDAIEHEPLEIHKARGETLLLSAEEFEAEKRNEVRGMMEKMGLLDGEYFGVSGHGNEKAFAYGGAAATTAQ
jgi:hypothetical protein